MTGCWSVANHTGLNHFLHLWHEASHVWFTLNSENTSRQDVQLLASCESQFKTYSHSTLMHILYSTPAPPTQTMPLLLVLQLIFCQEEAIIANKTTSLAQCLSCQRKFIEPPVCSPCGCPESCTITRHKSRWKMWNGRRVGEERRDRQAQTGKPAALLCGLCAREQLSIFRKLLSSLMRDTKWEPLGFGRPVGLLQNVIGSIS